MNRYIPKQPDRKCDRKRYKKKCDVPDKFEIMPDGNFLQIYHENFHVADDPFSTLHSIYNLSHGHLHMFISSYSGINTFYNSIRLHQTATVFLTKNGKIYHYNFRLTEDSMEFSLSKETKHKIKNNKIDEFKDDEIEYQAVKKLYCKLKSQEQ